MSFASVIQRGMDIFRNWLGLDLNYDGCFV